MIQDEPVPREVGREAARVEVKVFDRFGTRSPFRYNKGNRQLQDECKGQRNQTYGDESE